MERLLFPPATARVAAALLAGLFVIAHVGCEQSTQPTSGTNNLGPLGPEESFQRILERLKRRLEQGPRRIISSGLDADSNELSSFTLQDTVTGEVFPPEKEGEPYLAEVIIRTNAGFSHTRTIEEPEEKPKETDDIDSILSQLDEGGEQPLEVDSLLNPELAETEEPNAATSGRDTTAARAKPGTDTLTEPYSEVQRFELTYRDRKWELVEPVDEEREALSKIFEYALAGQ